MCVKPQHILKLKGFSHLFVTKSKLQVYVGDNNNDCIMLSIGLCSSVIWALLYSFKVAAFDKEIVGKFRSFIYIGKYIVCALH